MNDRFETLKHAMDSLSMMQNMIKYCSNPENERDMFYQGDAFYERNVLDYKLMTEMLTKINVLINNGKCTQQDASDFLLKNAHHFMRICPREFISSPLCPMDVLCNMRDGKYGDIEVKDVSHYEDTKDGRKLITNPSVYKNFNSTYGPILAKAIINVRENNLYLEQASVEKEIATVLYLVLKAGETARDIIETEHPNASSQQKQEYYTKLMNGENNFGCKNYITLLDDMKYNAGVQRAPIESLVWAKNLLRFGIHYATLDMIRKNFSTITKGIMPRLALSKTARNLSNDLSFVKIIAKKEMLFRRERGIEKMEPIDHNFDDIKKPSKSYGDDVLNNDKIDIKYETPVGEREPVGTGARDDR